MNAIVKAGSVIDSVKAGCAGRWRGILEGNGVELPARGKHGPCPGCGGTDRFRFEDNKPDGNWFCNNCDPKAGDGIALFAKAKGLSQHDAAKEIARLERIETSGGYTTLTPDEKSHMKTCSANVIQSDEYKKMAAEAVKIWQSSLPASLNHPYLVRKQIPPHDTKQLVANCYNGKKGDIVVPIYGENGIKSIEFISPFEGKIKFALKGAEKKGGFYPLDGMQTLTNAARIWIAEGFATGSSVRTATGDAVVCAFSANNIGNVAQLLKESYPNAEIVIAADSGKAGIEAARKSGLPYSAPAGVDDWNDFAVAGGDVASALVANIQQPEPVEQVPQYDEIPPDWHQQPEQKAPQQTISDDVFSLSSFSMESLPARDWVYDRLILKGYITALISPGGTGKSVFSIVMALSVALGRTLIPGHEVPKQRNVLLINNEDDADEMRRRAFACCMYYGIEPAELDGRLLFRSGYQKPLVLAVEGERRNTIEETPHKAELCDLIRANNIGLVVADPYVSIHSVPENDNTLQNEVVKILRSVCAETSVSMLLIAHTRKTGGHSDTHAGDVEAMRGASAVKDAARIVFTLARMSKFTADEMGIDWEIGNSLIRLDDAKMNFSQRAEDALWLRLASQQLPNGDWVGVPEAYDVDPHIEAKAKESEHKGGMTSHKWAAEIEKVIGDLPNKDCFAYSDVKERLTQGTGYKISSVERFVQLLSQDKNHPTRINISGSYIDYWVTKDAIKKTAPWHVNRAEL